MYVCMYVMIVTLRYKTKTKKDAEFVNLVTSNMAFKFECLILISTGVTSGKKIVT